MAQPAILNSYKEYHQAVLAKQFVDQMYKKGTSLDEASLQNIAENPVAYGLPDGATLGAIKNFLGTLTRISGSQEYNCTYAQIQESKQAFEKRRNLEKENLEKTADAGYDNAKKENKRLKRQLAGDRAKNVFGSLGRAGITGAIIAVPSALALSLIGGPVALAITAVSAIVGLVQHGIVRRLTDGIRNRRNARIRRTKYALAEKENFFGSNRQLAKAKENQRQAYAKYNEMLADEQKYLAQIEKGLQEGLAKEGTEPKIEVPKMKSDELHKDTAPKVSAPEYTLYDAEENAHTYTVPTDNMESEEVHKESEPEAQVQEYTVSNAEEEANPYTVTVEPEAVQEPQEEEHLVQGELFDPTPYEVEVPKKPRTRKPKSAESVEEVSLFDENLNPIQEDESEVHKDEEGAKEDEPEAEPESAEEEVEYEEEHDVYASGDSNEGKKVSKEELEAEMAKMKEEGLISDEPAPVISHDEPEEELKKEDDGMQRRLEEKEH